MRTTLLGVATLCLVPLSPATRAGPITFRFEGTAEVTLNGVSHPGSHYIIILSAMTENVVAKPWGYDVDGPATFEIAGVGSGSFDVLTRVFNNPGGTIAGFSQSELVGGLDLIDFVDPQLAAYTLSTPLGPIFDPDPFSAQFIEVPTSLGPLSLEALDVTFTAATTAPCYADCNGDGALNLSDFGCFTTKFALGDPYADCNGDQQLNLSDFGCFTTKFALGCP
ncbi:MAG: EF-hand domain-containing protein [Phycisphaerales bacterium]|nr:EF-hand domain-containing protein [Phycisphaerales bacterium]